MVLIQCPAWGIENPPLSLAILSAQVRKHDYKILPIDINAEFFHQVPEDQKKYWNIDISTWFWKDENCVNSFINQNEKLIDQYVDLIIATNTRVVGFSIYLSCLHMSLIFAEKIKNKAPHIKIIFGGPDASFNMSGHFVCKYRTN